MSAEIVITQDPVTQVLQIIQSGPRGPAGELTVGTVTTGAPGTDVAVTNSGTSTQAVLNFTIPRGNTGAAATIAAGTTTTGAPGTQAAVTNSGTSSAAVFNFTIPAGFDGDTPTVAVGDTTTGAPGTDATVNNVGTPTDLILNFEIPRGATGSIGDVTTDDLDEGTTNLYFTEDRVRGTDLAGLSTTAGTPTSADTVLSAIGKIIGKLVAHIAGTADKHAAADIVNTPAGNIAATNVQAAITELDTEKQPVNANLTALAGQTGAADRVSYWTAAATLALATLTSFGRTIIAFADAAAARTGLGLGTSATLDVDTDTTLAADSDTRVPSQHAVKTYVAAMVAGLLDLKGDQDCSANPNYPAGLKGDAYYVTVAGKIGGASGKTVDVGDMFIAKADNAGGTEASVGTSWFVLEKNIVGALMASNNLSDLANAGTARTNLGLGTLATQNGTFSGTSSGTNTGDQTTVTGNAGTATALATARNIDGVAFNGTANITVVAPATHAATSKGTPVDADEFTGTDSASSFVLVRFTWANIKATLLAYFNTKGLAGVESTGWAGTSNVTSVLADAGKSFDHPASDANARTVTIDSNANVAYPIGTVLCWSNMSTQPVTIAITSDTLSWIGTGGTGSRTLAQYGQATARKIASTTWQIGGVNLT